MQDNDKNWFDKEVRILLQVLNHSFTVKPSVIQRYWQAVETFTRSEVEAALTEINKSTEHFSPGDIRAAAQRCRTARSRREEEVSGRPGGGFDYDAPAQVQAHRRAMQTLQGMGYDVEIPEIEPIS